jgi:ribosomal protein L14E/L6E/L27E
MERVPINFKRLSLTDIKIEIKRVPKKKDLIKAMEAAGWFQIFMKSIFVLVFFC